MKKSVRLIPVCNLKRQQERKEAQTLAKYQKELTQSRQQHSELKSYLAEYYKSIQDQHGTVKNAAQLGLYQAFISRLQQAISRQGEMVKQRELSVQAQAKKWQLANHNVKIMEQLIEKAKTEESLIADKQEQKILDDRPYSKESGFR